MTSSALSKLARRLPLLRRVLARADAAEAALATMRAEVAQLREGQAAAQQQAAGSVIETFRRVLSASSEETWIRASLNGSQLWLPRDTLRIMPHCVALSPEGGLALWVETLHLRWMMERLEPGGTFLDVGSATGATTLPIAHTHGHRIRMVAYEPATAARDLLSATLARNGLTGVMVRGAAVSERSGTAQFQEYLFASDAVSFMPEMSSLIGSAASAGPHRLIDVPVVTLDEDAIPDCSSGRVVVKIDVEGFEAWVLRGATALIGTRRPWFSIDIHADPFGDGTANTEPAVRAILEPQGYTFERMGHVLLCTPPAD